MSIFVGTLKNSISPEKQYQVQTGLIHNHRKSSNKGKMLAPFRNATHFCGTRVSPYSKIYVLVYGPQYFTNLTVSVLEKQLRIKRQIHSRCNNPIEISSVAFLSLIWESSFYIGHLCTQFHHICFTCSSDLGKERAVPSSKSLGTGGNCMNLLSVLHCSRETVHTCMTFIAFSISLMKEVNVESPER